MSEVKTLTAAVSVQTVLSLADRLVAREAKPVEVKPEQEDLAVYGEIKYNVENDGMVHIVFPQTIPYKAFQQKATAKRAYFVQIKAEQVELNMNEFPNNPDKEQVMFMEPVQFELRLKFED